MNKSDSSESECSTNANEQIDISATEQVEDANEHNEQSAKRPLEDKDDHEVTYKRQRFEALAEEEQHEWQLPDELVRYSNKYFEKFVQEKSLKDSVLLENPVPTNVTELRKLDGYFKELLEEKNRRKELSLDTNFEKLQSKTRSIMGPLSKLWFRLEEALADEGEKVKLDLTELSQFVEQSVMLTGQAFNAVTYQRRLNVLSAVMDKHKSKNMIKDHATDLEKPNTFLFGESFRKTLKDTAKAKKESKEVFHEKYHNKRPFRKGPSSSSFSNKQQDGGRMAVFRKRRWENNNHIQSRGGKFQGGNSGYGSHTQQKFYGKKNFEKGTLPQHSTPKGQRKANFTRVCGDNPTTSVEPCTSNVTKIVSKKGYRQTSFSRKVKTLCKKLESVDKQSRNSTVGIRSKNRFHVRTHSAKNFSSDKNVGARILSNRPGSESYVGERCHSKVFTHKGTVSKQFIFSKQKGGGQQTSDKLEKSECIYSLSSLQNGRFAFIKGLIKREGLSVQDRFEGCILLRSLTSEPPKIYSISMERTSLRIPMFVLWPRTSTTYFHEITEGLNSSVTTNQCQSDHISRRHVTNGSNYRKSQCSQGYFDFSLTKPGICDKSEKVGFYPNSKIGILGDGGRLSEYDSDSTRTKGREVKAQMQITDFESKDISMGGDKPNWFPLLHSPSSITSVFTSKISATTTITTDKSKVSLPIYVVSKSGSYSGTPLVGKQFRDFQWEGNFDYKCQGIDPNRCIQKRMGCILPFNINRRAVDSTRIQVSHQCVGIEGNTFSSSNLHKDVSNQICPLSSGQYGSFVLPDENGGNSQQRDDCHSKGDLELCHIKGNHDYCRIPSWKTEHQGRLGFTKFSGFKRVASVSQSISMHSTEVGHSRDRSVCVKSVSSVTGLHGLETRSLKSSNRCITTTMEESRSPICFSTIFADRQSSSKSYQGEGYDDINHPKLASTTLVQSNSRYVCSATPTSASASGPSVKSAGPNTSFGSEQNFKIGGLESHWKSLATEGISERASKLITSARRPGTASNYESSWRKWTSWCSEQQVDPITCNLKYVLDFLAYLFEQNYEYSTINSHRSAISAYHEYINDRPVGQHQNVCKLMTGVFNQNPPKPRYSCIWDVELVLKYINSLPDNSNLSDRTMLLKLTTLLFLTSAGRCHEICYLDVRYMVRTSCTYKFYFSKLTKSWKKGKAPPCLELNEFLPNRKLCVVSCTEDYLARSNVWRDKGQNQLLLSHLKPHKEVQKSTIAGWVKIILKNAGIDTSLFKAHSCRAASTSKAKVMGLSLQEILKRGQWSRESTWQKHYCKPIEKVNENFESMILQPEM